ncbi:hypothetical protein P153DRAFT_254424, partial [Dothidotthia symphoricarpi CBS 119687]
RYQGRYQSHTYIPDRYEVDELPARYAGSRLYQNSCREGVSLNPRTFAAFDRLPSTVYSYLLEGIVMIIFGTYQDIGIDHMYCSPASYNLTAKIRASLNLPEVSWCGLNGAWTMYQGIPSIVRKFDAPCGNPLCGRIIYYKIDGKVQSRILMDSSDPLGPHLCKPCWRWRFNHNRLPNVEDLALRATRAARKQTVSELRAAFPPNEAPCAHCGRPECCF